MKLSSFKSTILDDNGQTFPIEINYDYHDYMGWRPEIVVTGYEYKLQGAIIDRRVLEEIVEDLIRDDARCNVTFNI